MLPPINPTVFELSMEQELLLEQTRRGAKAASREDLEAMLVSMCDLYLRQQSVLKNLVKGAG